MGKHGGSGGSKKTAKSGGDKKKSSGETRKRTDSRDNDPAGSCRVYVIGFDRGTTDEQFEGHMKQAGPINSVHWVSKCKAVVVSKKKSSAAKAKELSKST